MENKYKKLLEERKEINNENKILKQKFHMIKRKKNMADIQIKFKKINKAKVVEKDLEEEEKKIKLNYMRKKKLFDNLSKSVILKDSSEIFKADDKSMENISKEEDYFKNTFMEKYNKSITDGNGKTKTILLRRQSIKENEEKINNFKNEIGLSENSILSLSRKNSELKEEYDSKIEEVKAPLRNI